MCEHHKVLFQPLLIYIVDDEIILLLFRVVLSRLVLRNKRALAIC